MDKLANLLEAHKLLVTGHPNLKNLRATIEKMLADLDASYAPKPADPPKVIPAPAPEPEAPAAPTIERKI